MSVLRVPLKVTPPFVPKSPTTSVEVPDLTASAEYALLVGVERVLIEDAFAHAAHLHG